MDRRKFICTAVMTPALFLPKIATAQNTRIYELLHKATHRNGTGSPEHFDTEHAFMYDPNSPTRLASMPECKVIKIHGSSKITPTGWIRFDFPKSRWPLFVNPSAGITSISKATLGKIVSGEVRNWSEVGGHDLEITLITNWGIALKGLRSMLHENGMRLSASATRESINCGISIGTPSSDNGIKNCGGYSDMLGVALETSGALVFGLREVKPSGLVSLMVDGRAFSLDAGSDYPLERGFAVLVREGDQVAADKFEAYLTRLIRRKETDLLAGYDQFDKRKYG